MEELENAVEVEAAEVQPSEEQPKQSKAAKAGAAIKEWFRKFTVKLKHRPMNIAFFVMIVSTVLYLCSLGKYSQAVLLSYNGVEWLGFSIFVNTLFCILSLLLFMNSFPKRSKKPKVVMLVLFFVFVAAMITFDVLFYVRAGSMFNADLAKPELADKVEAAKEYMIPALNTTIAHIVLVGLGAILTATYPLYGKLLNMINTKKVIESTEIKEVIETEDE